MSNPNVPDERRVQFVRLIEAGMPTQTAANQIGVGRTTGQRWAMLYRVGGLAKLASLEGAAPKYPFAIKVLAARARLDGFPEQAVLEAFGLRSSKTLSRWIHAYQERGAAGLGGTKEEEDEASSTNGVEIRGRLWMRHSDQSRRLFAEAVAKGHGYEAASKIVGIPFSTGWAWYQKHRAGQPILLAAVTRPQTYTAALKLEVAKAIVDEGHTRAEVMARFNIGGHSTLKEWVRRYRQHGDAAFASRPKAQPTQARGTARLARERDALTELIGRLDPDLPTDAKVRLVASLAELYPVRPLLRALKLPASTYYYRRSRPARPDRYENVRPLLRDSFATAFRAYGYRRLRMQLRLEHGVAISGKTVRRLMREEGCICVVRRRKRRRSAGPAPHPANVFAPNLLNRDFAATEPGQKWVTDVTQFTVAGELLFLSPLIDLFNGEVLSYRLDVNQGMPVILGMLRDALPHARRGVTILHSDRGWQYQHAGFRGALRSAGITQSMSRSGNCYDNACAENFFSHFKQEFLRGRQFGSVEEFTDQFAAWIEWFNTARLSEKRGWTSPRGYAKATALT
jgi:transposase InsO family protein/transposase-like protein